MIKAPVVENRDAAIAFNAALSGFQLDPEDPWVGGYVGYEWAHARHFFDCLGGPACGLEVLEYGCNLGATAIVLAHLGMNVTAVDVNPAVLLLAALNAAQYRLAGKISFLHCDDFARAHSAHELFDVVVCNSVLEYVAGPELQSVQRLLDRMLKPGGYLFVLGTSNRLSLREVHSGRWFVNYLPKPVDGWLRPAREVQRGLSPIAARHGFGRHYDNLDQSDGAKSYLMAQQKMGATWSKLCLLGVAGALAKPFGWTAGMLTPCLNIRLRKRSALNNRLGM